MAAPSDEILVPLTESESEIAKAAAVAYLEPQILHDGKSRFRVLGAELWVTRALSKDEPIRREVEVLVLDYLGRRQIAVVVERDRVVEVRELEGQAAFVADEVAEAEAIATEEEPRLKIIARQRSVFSSAFAPGSAKVGSRNIGIRFVLTKEDAPAEELASAIVDLVEQRLISYRIDTAGE